MKWQTRQASGGSKARPGKPGKISPAVTSSSNGYTILETNYRSRYGEIDIIARRSNIVAFIEVKSRRGQRYGEPFEAVAARKQNQIRRMAEMWVAARAGDRDLRECSFRFDVITVMLSVQEEASAWSRTRAAHELSTNAAGIQHIEDAFR